MTTQTPLPEYIVLCQVTLLGIWPLTLTTVIRVIYAAEPSYVASLRGPLSGPETAPVHGFRETLNYIDIFSRLSTCYFIYFAKDELKDQIGNYTAIFAAVLSIMASGPPPGIDLSVDIKESIISPVIALMVLSGVCVALRIVSKVQSKVNLQLEDYFILASVVCISLNRTTPSY